MRVFKVTFLLFSAAALLAASIKNVETKKIMDSVFLSMDTLLPLSLKLDDFSNPKNRKVIQKAITQLKQNASQLSKHVETSSANNKIASANLTIDILELNKLYNEKEYERARFVLHSLTENCVGCHTRLHPNEKQPGLQVHFSEVNKQQLNGFDLAHFEIMGRNFDSGMSLYEAEFRKDPKLLDSQSFFEYLKVAIRVKMSLDRIGVLLAEIQPKLDKKMDIYEISQKWQKSISDIKSMNIEKNINIETAELLLSKAGAINSYPKDEAGIIYLLTASYILHTMLDTNKLDTEQLARVYYYLGRTEGFISLSCWLREYDHYFEQSIRTKPSSLWAKKSFESLKAELNFDYSGSSGTNLPKEEKNRIKDLGDLIGKAQSKAP